MTTLEGNDGDRFGAEGRTSTAAMHQLAALARIAQQGLRGGDVDEILLEAMGDVAAALRVPSVMLFEHVPGSREFTGRAIRYQDVPILPTTARWLHVPDGHGSLPGYTLDVGTVVTSVDLLEDRRFTAQAPNQGLPARSAVTAPIIVDGASWGVVAAYDAVVRDWSDPDVQFVRDVADVLGSILTRHLADIEMRDASTRVDLSLAGGGMGAWTWDVRSDAIELSPSAAAIYGTEPGTFDTADDLFGTMIHPEDQPRLRSSFHEAIQTSADPHGTYRIIRGSDGQVRWLETWGRLVYEDGQPVRLIGVLADITERRQAEAERDALLAAEQRARAAAEAAHERMELLVEASERFGSTLDAEVILGMLPELCVPALADLCTVTLADEEGVLVEVGARTVDEAALALVREFRASASAAGGAGMAERVTAVLRQGESVHLGELTEADRRTLAVDEVQQDMARAAGVRSVVVVPLNARGTVIGVMTLLITVSHRQFDADQLQLAEQLATRAALAVDNSRLYAAGQRVSRSLQAALLPPALPDIPGVLLAAQYQVAEQDLDIGGDFYDVMELQDGAWGVVVGDVCGRGPDAAALTGLMRHSVRTAVVREDEPSRVLAQTNAAVLAQIDDARFSTAAYVRVHAAAPATGTVRLRASSAGHPQPVVLRSGPRSAQLLDCGGVLLGVVPSPEFVDVDLTLEPGDALVLYTDGVTEARRAGDFFGEERLLSTLSGFAGQDAESIAHGLERAVFDFSDETGDDMAILVIQARPTTMVS